MAVHEHTPLLWELTCLLVMMDEVRQGASGRWHLVGDDCYLVGKLTISEATETSCIANGAKQ